MYITTKPSDYVRVVPSTVYFRKPDTSSTTLVAITDGKTDLEACRFQSTTNYQWIHINYPKAIDFIEIVAKNENVTIPISLAMNNKQRFIDIRQFYPVNEKKNTRFIFPRTIGLMSINIQASANAFIIYDIQGYKMLV